MSKKYSYQRRMGEFIEEHIPNQILKKRNKKKSWEYGYNEEFDMVIVSKDGTISQPYMLSGLMICPPASSLGTSRGSHTFRYILF